MSTRSAYQMSAFQIAAGQSALRAAAGALEYLREAVDGLLTRLVRWNRRANERRAMRRLDDHLLRDIGIGRLQLEQMAARPFWRA
ncbi:MAG: DUF1127 domain-containing protein [Rhodospirillaceae bacterium]|nr:DUF1127 domain-containing protein [Rhodospirillaceae bacterium]